MTSLHPPAFQRNDFSTCTYYDGLQESYTSFSCASLRNQTVINFPHENQVGTGTQSVYIHTVCERCYPRIGEKGVACTIFPSAFLVSCWLVSVTCKIVTLLHCMPSLHPLFFF